MKIFIDFDDVIFNTRKFTNDYKKVFNFHGISGKIYEKYYYDYPINKGKNFKKYHSEMHIREIGKNFPVNMAKLESDIINFTKNTKKYVFRDVPEFMKQYNKKDLYLISFPRIKFQNSKITNSGITKYLNKHILTDGLKSGEIRNLIGKGKIKKKETVYFIDDRLEIVEDAKKKIPQIIAILLRRKEGRHKYSRKGKFDFEATNLNEVTKIIKNSSNES